MGWLWSHAGARKDDRVAPQTIGLDEIRCALERRGVPATFSSALAERAAGQAAQLDGVAFDALLDGVGIAFALQQSTQDELTKNLRGLREVERMMGAFSGELSKLDEVLGVLAAYVRRMKTSGSSVGADRVLH